MMSTAAVAGSACRRARRARSHARSSSSLFLFVASALPLPLPLLSPRRRRTRGCRAAAGPSIDRIQISIHGRGMHGSARGRAQHQRCSTQGAGPGHQRRAHCACRDIKGKKGPSGAKPLTHASASGRRRAGAPASGDMEEPAEARRGAGAGGASAGTGATALLPGECEGRSVTYRLRTWSSEQGAVGAKVRRREEQPAMEALREALAPAAPRKPPRRVPAAEHGGCAGARRSRRAHAVRRLGSVERCRCRCCCAFTLPRAADGDPCCDLTPAAAQARMSGGAASAQQRAPLSASSSRHRATARVRVPPQPQRHCAMPHAPCLRPHVRSCSPSPHWDMGAATAGGARMASALRRVQRSSAEDGGPPACSVASCLPRARAPPTLRAPAGRDLPSAEASPPRRGRGYEGGGADQRGMRIEWRMAGAASGTHTCALARADQVPRLGALGEQASAAAAAAAAARCSSDAAAAASGMHSSAPRRGSAAPASFVSAPGGCAAHRAAKRQARRREQRAVRLDPRPRRAAAQAARRAADNKLPLPIRCSEAGDGAAMEVRGRGRHP